MNLNRYNHDIFPSVSESFRLGSQGLKAGLYYMSQPLSVKVRALPEIESY